MDSQRLKKRGLDCSPLQVPSAAKRSANKPSSASSHTATRVIKLEKEDSVSAPMAQSEPNSSPSMLSIVDQILDIYDYVHTLPMAQLDNLVPLNSSSQTAPRVKLEATERDAPLRSRLLSRLRSPGIDKNNPADVVRRSFALVAKSLREALVSKLTSDHEVLDLDSVIHLANAAFESLGSLEGESPELYRAVKDLIVQRHELSEAEKELRSIGHSHLEDTVARCEALLARSSEASKAFFGAKASLERARKAVVEKRGLMRKLEEEVAEGEKEIGSLEAEFERVKEACLAVAAEQEDVAKRVEEEREIARRSNGRRDEAKAGIERTKALLASMLA